MISFLFPDNIPQLISDNKYNETREEYKNIVRAVYAIDDIESAIK